MCNIDEQRLLDYVASIDIRLPITCQTLARRMGYYNPLHEGQLTLWGRIATILESHNYRVRWSDSHMDWLIIGRVPSYRESLAATYDPFYGDK